MDAYSQAAIDLQSNFAFSGPGILGAIDAYRAVRRGEGCYRWLGPLGLLPCYSYRQSASAGAHSLGGRKISFLLDADPHSLAKHCALHAARPPPPAAGDALCLAEIRHGDGCRCACATACQDCAYALPFCRS
jgi:hypothetical protein